MTFKGDKIVGKPTLAMIEIHIAEKGFNEEDAQLVSEF